ncbi:MAG: hypothetical protein ACTSXX_01640 [Candidatus Baldrarchaeia archaeon]
MVESIRMVEERFSGIPRIRVVDMGFGTCELSDGTLVKYRVAVVDVRVLRKESPFGVEFEANLATGISVYPSKKVLEEYRDKRILTPGESPPSSWKQVRIVKREPAFEEVEFESKDVGRYRIRVEVEPVMASVNTEVRTVHGEPYYVIRWIPKMSWEKVVEESGG